MTTTDQQTADYIGEVIPKDELAELREVTAALNAKVPALKANVAMLEAFADLEARGVLPFKPLAPVIGTDLSHLPRTTGKLEPMELNIPDDYQTCGSD